LAYRSDKRPYVHSAELAERDSPRTPKAEPSECRVLPLVMYGSPFGTGHEKVGEGDLASRPVEGRASEDKAGVGQAIAEATWGEREAVAATSR